MEYLYFTFNGISSSKFNTFIINNGEDLSFPSQPGFDNKIVSPLFQGASYLAGVDIKDRTFSIQCWTQELNTGMFNQLIKWLNVESQGDLIFDFNPNFKYRAKIQSISDFTHLPSEIEDTLNFQFSMSFTTIEDSAATSILSYSNITGDNFDGFPIGVSGGADVIYLYNFYNSPL